MKKIPFTLLLPGLMLSISVMAYDSTIEPQKQGAVTFISGGVGTEEINEMRTLRANYNLNLLFSVRGSGDYLSDVKVQITDSRGNTVIEAVAEGPMLFAKLKPGRYIVTVGQAGRVIKKTTAIKSNGHTALSFTWPQLQSDLEELGVRD